MGSLLTTFDLVIFFGALIAIMGVGLWAGRKEDTSEDFYLAGKQTRWWGVAGSIFGSNVSANHIVGMMGVGYTAGFAQSHFEITAIAGLLMLCYAFLPVYRKLNVFTLSDYLGRRYDDSSRIAYALIMILIMVVIQMVPGFYIGSRAINILLQGGERAIAEAVVDETGAITEILVKNGGKGYASAPQIEVALPSDEKDKQSPNRAMASATVANGKLASIAVDLGGVGYDSAKPPLVTITGGAGFDAALSPSDVNPSWYKIGIIIMAIVTGTYVIIGGLKAVIVTDVIQSVLMLAAGIIVALFMFAQPEIGWWTGLAATDAAGADKLHLYLPTDHAELPWTGVLSGLMVLHFYYWGTNQFIVQRALSARSDREARMGIITAGFFKLLIPFFSIGTGIAAYYFFAERKMVVAQDAVFIRIMTELIVPFGFGLVGFIAAGVFGAILSSLDSMMNSAATIFTFDVYQRYVDPEASERKLIGIGRICIVVFIIAAATLTIFTMDPNSKDSFFLQIASHQGRLIAGVVVAFALGMLWRRATSAGAIVAIIAGVGLSYGLEPLYNKYLGTQPNIAAVFGEKINFLHAVFVAAIASAVLHVVVSLCSQPDEEKSKLTWTGLGVFEQAGLRRAAMGIALSLAVFAVLGVLVVQQVVTPTIAAWIAAVWTFIGFLMTAMSAVKRDVEKGEITSLLTQDRFWAGLLAACAIFMMYYFY